MTTPSAVSGERTTTHTFSLPPNVMGLGLVRIKGEEFWGYEPLRYIGGNSEVHRELRTLAAIGGLAAGESDFQLDYYTADQSIVGEVAITRRGYDYYRRRARPKRLFVEKP